jgi:mannose-6-phosphate isomerase-like protein (cupin superfamily)
MIKRSEEMRTEIRQNMRGGDGDVTLIHMLEKEDMPEKARLAARMVIPVGGSIGEHAHGPDAEIYIIVSGVARVVDSEGAHILNAGDSAYTSGGESHSCANAGDTPLEIIGIVIN